MFKNLLKGLGIVCLALVYSCSTPAEPTGNGIYFIAIPLDDTDAGFVQKANIIRATLSKGVRGERFIILDASRRQEIVEFDFANPKARFHNAKLMKSFLSGGLNQLKNYFAQNRIDGHDSAIQIPDLLNYVGKRKSEFNKDTPIQILALGDPRYKTIGYYGRQKDGLLLSDGVYQWSDSPWLIRSEDLKGIAVHVIYPHGTFENEWHRNRIERRYGLLLKMRGGSLKTFTADPYAFKRLGNPNIKPPSFEPVNRFDNSRVTYSPVKLEVKNLFQKMVYNFPPPSDYMVRDLKLVLTWQENVDADLRATTGGEEVFFNHKQSKGQSGLKWTKQLETGFEAVEFPVGSKVDIRTIKNIYAQFWSGKSHTGVHGILTVYANGNGYTHSFHIKGERGDKAKSWRRGSNTWYKFPPLTDIVGMTGGIR